MSTEDLENRDRDVILYTINRKDAIKLAKKIRAFVESLLEEEVKREAKIPAVWEEE